MVGGVGGDFSQTRHQPVLQPSVSRRQTVVRLLWTF